MSCNCYENCVLKIGFQMTISIVMTELTVKKKNDIIVLNTKHNSLLSISLT